MVRAPCCAKEGLKRGPWSQEEDNILTSYIHQHGHANWRALPKQAGLLRCGKSCRLRWTNYLRPDIKRGNFSKEEEDTIIQLHQLLGNRWSAIAGKLSGRTDNEIKNVWHTHLKKRLQNYARVSKGKFDGKVDCHHQSDTPSDESESFREEFVSQPDINSSSQQSSMDVSSVTKFRDSLNVIEDEQVDISSEAVNEIDESFWTDAFSADISTEGSSCMGWGFPLSPLSTFGLESVDSKMYDGMGFWYDVFNEAEELPVYFRG